MPLAAELSGARMSTSDPRAHAVAQFRSVAAVLGTTHRTLDQMDCQPGNSTAAVAGRSRQGSITVLLGLRT